MRHLLRGKLGGFLGLLVIAALVIGGLGYVTALALGLEEKQQQTVLASELTLAERDQAHKLRLALWRLDTHVYADLAREANRPYHDYTAHIATVPPDTKVGDNNKALTVLELLSTRAEDAPSWMHQSYLVALESDWKAPQALRDDLVRHLNLSRLHAKLEQRAGAGNDPWIGVLNRNNALQEYLFNVRQQPEVNLQAQPGQQLLAPNPPGGVSRDGGRGNETNVGVGRAGLQNTAQGKTNVDPDTAARMMRSQTDRQGPAYQTTNQANPLPGDVNRADKVQATQPVVILGPMTPLWLTEGNDNLLVLARLVQIGRKPACQVTILDWPTLQSELFDRVYDLLPDAKLEPEITPTEDSPNQEQTLTALPVRLDPGPVMVIPAPWDGSSLRYGLALAWGAALLGILAVALGGWALLALSERRIRFVSAVTHELRTPLTSLRLYLDMLTSGFVTDEKRKEEYLNTLNTETDRLNRLVGNVLDFSRLENQRPKLALTYVTVSDLLYQIRSTWEGRCQDAGKQLTLENQIDENALLHTDEQMVQQVLGNLIDNACKYSRGADDPRIVVRAREANGRLVLEVHDHGPGVLPRDRRSIFRAFRRGRGADVTAGGVGLGLALAQRWTGLLGGSITLANGESTGACFRVELPGLNTE